MEETLVESVCLEELTKIHRKIFSEKFIIALLKKV